MQEASETEVSSGRVQNDPLEIDAFYHIVPFLVEYKSRRRCLGFFQRDASDRCEQFGR